MKSWNHESTRRVIAIILLAILAMLIGDILSFGQLFSIAKLLLSLAKVILLGLAIFMAIFAMIEAIAGNGKNAVLNAAGGTIFIAILSLFTLFGKLSPISRLIVLILSVAFAIELIIAIIVIIAKKVEGKKRKDTDSIWAAAFLLALLVAIFILNIASSWYSS